MNASAVLLGVLLTEVIWVEKGAIHPFVIAGAATKDLMRPSLYDAWHQIEAAAPNGRSFVAAVRERQDVQALIRGDIVPDWLRSSVG